MESKDRTQKTNEFNISFFEKINRITKSLESFNQKKKKQLKQDGHFRNLKEILSIKI